MAIRYRHEEPIRPYGSNIDLDWDDEELYLMF